MPVLLWWGLGRSLDIGLVVAVRSSDQVSVLPTAPLERSSRGSLRSTAGGVREGSGTTGVASGADPGDLEESPGRSARSASSSAAPRSVAAGIVGVLAGPVCRPCGRGCWPSWSRQGVWPKTTIARERRAGRSGMGSAGLASVSLVVKCLLDGGLDSYSAGAVSDDRHQLVGELLNGEAVGFGSVGDLVGDQIVD